MLFALLRGVYPMLLFMITVPAFPIIVMGDRRGAAGLLGLQGLCHAKVADFEVPLLRHEDVLHLKVQVHDASAMYVHHRLHHLPEPHAHLLLGEHA